MNSHDDTHLVDQVEHSGGTRGIASSQEAKDVSRVGNALDGQVASSSDTRSQSIEEGWAFGVGLAYITG